MIDVAEQWNPKQALLKNIIQKSDRFSQAIELSLEMHSLVHTSEMSGIKIRTFEDCLWDELDEEIFRTMPTEKDVTIAWNIWHLTRIEDMTSNVLIADDSQVIIKGSWLKKLSIDIYDTGNTMNKDEIKAFSKNVDMKELRNYRIAVGRKTQEIIRQLEQTDIKKKVKPDRLQRIFNEGGVLEESKWLLEFWGKKTIGGILQMPITRHQIVHLNDSLKIKHRLNKRIK